MRGILLCLASGMFAVVMPAAADTLNLFNCSGQSVTIRTFNEGDTVCWVERTLATVSGCGSAGFTCEGKCKVEVDGSVGSSINACSTLRIVDGNQIHTVHGYVVSASDPAFSDELWFQNCTCMREDIPW